MEKLDINKSNQGLPIHTYLWNNKSDTLVLFIDGDGHLRDFDSVASKLSNIKKNCDYMTFAFRGVEEKLQTDYSDFINDFKELMKYINENFNYNQILLVCTSSGAIVTSIEISNPTTNITISNAIFLDPADYYIDDKNKFPSDETWSGNQKYSPQNLTVSQRLTNIQSEVKVYIVGFTIRNSHGDHYTDASLRHIDNPALYPRLNQDMVKSFYNNVPENNKGKYFTNNKIPHAYIRDGNIDSNTKEIVNILTELL